MKLLVTFSKSGITIWNHSFATDFLFAIFRNTNSLMMKSTVLVLSFLFLTLPFAFSQSKHINLDWAKTFGKGSNDVVHQILEDADGNILVIGDTKPYGTRYKDISVLKLGPDGNLIWGKRYGGKGEDNGRSICSAHNGGYIIAGSSTIKSNKSFLGILKLNFQGDQVWTKTYSQFSNVKPKKIIPTSDDGYVLIGNEKQSRNLNTAVVLKFTSSGNILWSKKYGNTKSDQINDVLELPNGGYVLCGKKMTFGTARFNFWILKLDANGNQLLEKTYGGMNDQEATAMMRMRDGNLLIVGNEFDERKGTSSLYYIKIGRKGQLFWDGNLGRYYEEKAYSVTLAPDGYLIAGFRKEKTGGKNLTIRKIAENGGLVWQHSQEGRDHATLTGRKEGTEAVSMIASRNGGFIIGGNSGLFLMSKLVVKFNFGTGQNNQIDTWPEINFSKNDLIEEPIAQNDLPKDVTPKSVPNYDAPEEDQTSSEIEIIEAPEIISDVDVNIPGTYLENENTFALIIGNEDYTTFQSDLNSEVNVDFAENDARIFKEYCVKSLGIPERNINLLVNATYGQMLQGISKLEKLAEVSEGRAKLVFYYAGHGLPHEQSKDAYLMPVDINAANLESGIKLDDLYSRLSKHPTKRVTVFLDACFSGAGRNQGLLAMRGVKIRARKAQPIKGNMVVFSSSTGLESSGPFHEQKHGLFTYFLLKKIQESRGIFTYGDLSDYIRDNVRLESVLSNSKEQTPEVQVSREAEESWESWRF